MSAGDVAGQPASRDELDKRMDAAWRGFRASLADALTTLGEDAHCYVRPQDGLMDDGEYLWASVWRRGRRLLVTVPSNTYLPAARKLSPAAMRRLREMGMTRAHSSADYQLEVPLRHVDQAAEVITTAYRDCLMVLHPSCLEVTGAAVVTRPRAAEPSPVALGVIPDDHEHLRELLADAVSRIPGERSEDEDGDYVFWTEGAVVCLGLHPKSPVVILRSVVLRNISRVDAARLAVNELNAERRGVTFILEGNSILAEMHLLGMPFAAHHVGFGLGQMLRVTEEASQQLRDRVGGQSYGSGTSDLARTEMIARSLVRMLADGPLSARQVAGVCGDDPEQIQEVIDCLDDDHGDWEAMEPYVTKAVRLLRRALRSVTAE